MLNLQYLLSVVKVDKITVYIIYPRNLNIDKNQKSTFFIMGSDWNFVNHFLITGPFEVRFQMKHLWFLLPSKRSSALWPSCSLMC